MCEIRRHVNFCLDVHARLRNGATGQGLVYRKCLHVGVIYSTMASFINIGEANIHKHDDELEKATYRKQMTRRGPDFLPAFTQ